MKVVLALLLALALPTVAAPSARAAESLPVQSARATATLVSDTDRAEPGHPLHLGLRLRLAPGWHTYWKNPGDAGAPPELDLTLPKGVRAGPILWPVPERLLDAGLMSYAYTGDLLLPVEVTPGENGLQVDAKASWLVCATVCVPEEGTFHLALSKGAAAPSAQAPLFAASFARQPRPSPFAATIAPDGTLVLRGSGLSSETVRDAWFLPDQPDRIAQAAPQRVAVGDGNVRIQLKGAGAKAFATSLGGVVVLRDPAGQDAFLTVSAAPGSPVGITSGALPGRLPLAQALLFAVLAGVILNAMPCVFPVLAMKAVGLAGLSGAARGSVRRAAVSYTAGVILAFLALGGALLLARAAGAAAGWGFQFQLPAFVTALAWILFLVGLNLSGVFEVGGGLAGAGQGLAGRGGHLGSFFTGVLAVVVATPCTAPFMAAAIAAALAEPLGATLLVFAAMGLGLAAPYALLALVPGAARVLPRPGPWMDVLRQALAFPMYAAVAWLLWVVSQQAGSTGVLATAAGLVLAGFGAWVMGVAQRAAGRGRRRLGRGIALATALAAAAVLAGVAEAPATAVARADKAEGFTSARFAGLRAAGRPVFVDATAAWCVTCLVNERVALAPAPVHAAFARYGVAYLKADWTRQDPEITAFLRRFGRDGVPLYVVFPASHDGAPEVLPQVLTEGVVLDALRRAAG